MRTRLMWSFFAVGIILAGGLMAFFSVRLLELEDAQAQATRDALADENVRLALWRMDSGLAPLVTEEAARPYFHYLSFYPAERPYTRMLNEVSSGEVLVPSPLLTSEQPQVLVHFQYGPDGTLTSPQVPDDAQRTMAELRYLPSGSVDEARARLTGMDEAVGHDELIRCLPRPKVEMRDPVEADAIYANSYWQAKNNENTQEYAQRAGATQKQAEWRKNEQRIKAFGPVETEPVEFHEGPMTALWVNDRLVLARSILVDGEIYVQGCLLDWDRIRGELLKGSDDLVPNAALQPVADLERVEAANVHRLATLPVEVLPGVVPVTAPEAHSPLRATMYVAWACLALVALGMGFVLHRTLSLAQRRAEFVSAVSHELRTPLTTFRMYTEMLTSGMVKDESARDEYLKTLHSESLRLGHLVENVLAYARLENASTADRVEELPLGHLLNRATERLGARTGQAGMELVVEAHEEDATVRADPAAVEQIVFNLVDNACKYASGATDKRIHLTCQVSGDRAEIRVRDHGPGIRRQEGTRLFKPFRKSAQAAAESAPGVGLGLTLSRRLARAMNGDLKLDNAAKDGCSFILTLPR